MSLDILKKELKENKIKSIYLFYGPEEYLLKYYLNQIKEAVVTGIPELNLLVLEAEKATSASIVEFCDSPPMMSEKKLLVIKKFPGFKKKSNDDGSKKDSFAEYLSEIPEFSHIILVEEDVDKRSKLYKLIEKNGLAVEFTYQPKEMLINWAAKILREHGKAISKDDAAYLIDNLDPDMQSILNETMKLVDYAGERDTITSDDIDKICTKSLSSKVFEMMDSIGQKNLQNAFSRLNEMISLKEPVVKILFMLARHIRILLQIKMDQAQGISPNITAQKLKIGFINKYAGQSKNFTLEKLRTSLNGCSEADLEIKTRGVDDRIVLEKLIVEIAG